MQAVVHGVHYQFARTLEAQLVLNAGAQGIDRGNGQAQLPRDLPSAFALSQQAEDFQFTVAESFDAGP